MTLETHQTLPNTALPEQSPPSVGTHRIEPTLNTFDNLWINWIYDLQINGYSFYKFDVTFNSSGPPRPSKWIDYYNGKVLYKMTKLIGINESLITHIREYEHGIKSRKRLSGDWRCPHHVHSLIGVPSHLGHHMTSDRLKKDIESLPLVSSVHIVLIPDNDLHSTNTVIAAYTYMRKGKFHRLMGAD